MSTQVVHVVNTNSQKGSNKENSGGQTASSGQTKESSPTSGASAGAPKKTVIQATIVPASGSASNHYTVVTAGKSKSGTLLHNAVAGTQYIVTAVGGGASGNNNNNSEQSPEIVAVQHGNSQYTTAQPVQQFQAYADGSMYPQGSYYQGNSGYQVAAHVSAYGIPGQLVNCQGNTYIVQSEGNGSHALSHTTRASPATVQWLVDNFEPAEGCSLRRSTLYNFYLHHCNEQKLEPVNPASFGKLIRSVFLGLRTRRLGTRGNSKYHYYGLRVKANSTLSQYSDDQTMALRQTPLGQSKRLKSLKYENDASMNASQSAGGASTNASAGSAAAASEDEKQNVHKTYLGDASGALSNFGAINLAGVPIPDPCTEADIRELEALYKDHCEMLLDSVLSMQFQQVEHVWKAFWRNCTPDDSHVMAQEEYNRRLPRDKLMLLCQLEPVQAYMKTIDYQFFQHLVEILIPDVLRQIPTTLTQAIRNFAKSLESWLRSSTNGLPEKLQKFKMTMVTAFAQTLRRYTSLNHLAQAARAVLQNSTQISQMLTDLNRVDFGSVQEQASWVCECDDKVVTSIDRDFKQMLSEQHTLEEWAAWLTTMTEDALKNHVGDPDYPIIARQFLLKWSFYSSMVIRDLTLRSAASFGSFHLIRLLYDEYLFYLVEHKVAVATNQSPIAVMTESKLGEGNPGALKAAPGVNHRMSSSQVRTSTGNHMKPSTKTIFVTTTTGATPATNTTGPASGVRTIVLKQFNQEPPAKKMKEAP